jgi:molybdopterin molybdotransferase
MTGTPRHGRIICGKICTYAGAGPIFASSCNTLLMADPRPELSVDEAVGTVLDAVTPGSLPDQMVGIEAAIGRVLARPVCALWSLPSAPLSIMDGYAVRSEDLLAARARSETLVLALASESAAGHPSELVLEPGSCMRIATGAVVPAGTDAVVPQEDARRLAPDRVELSAVALAQAAPGRFIRPIGSDVNVGELLLEPGVVMGGGEVSLLAGAGHVEVAVRRRPIVAILGSGDELVPIGQTPARGQIVSTNTMMLAAQIREAGGEPLDLGFVRDTETAVRAAIEQAIEQADLLVGTGGISVGDHDLLLPVLEQIGFTQRFRKLALRPGRPSTFGMLPRGAERAPLLVLALPGNPASTMVAFELLGRPLIRAWLGLPRHRWQRRPRSVELAAAAEGDRMREHFVRAKLDEHGRAHPLIKQLSGALRSIADFDVLLRVPAGRTRVEAGESLPALFLRE